MEGGEGGGCIATCEEGIYHEGNLNGNNPQFSHLWDSFRLPTPRL
jgi:hypothetical protein